MNSIFYVEKNELSKALMNKQASLCRALNENAPFNIQLASGENCEIKYGKGSEFKQNEDYKTNDSIDVNGFNPKVALMEKISSFKVKTFKSKIFPVKNFITGDEVQVSDLVTNVTNDSNNNTHFFEKMYVRINVENDFFNNKTQTENTVMPRPGQFSELSNLAYNVSNAANPRYKKIRNYMNIIPYAFNTIENAAYTGMLGENVNDNLKHKLTEAFDPNTGEYYKKLLCGTDHMYGLFNQPSVFTLNAEDASNLMGNTKSLEDIFNGSETNLNIFVEKIKRILGGSYPTGFTSIRNDYISHNHFTHPVLLVPTSVYNGLAGTRYMTANGGVMQYKDDTKTIFITLCGMPIEILPASVLDHIYTNDSSVKQYSQVDSHHDMYMLYDKDQLFRLITTPIREIYAPVTTNFGTQIQGCFIGSMTDVFSITPYTGIKWTVAQG